MIKKIENGARRVGQVGVGIVAVTIGGLGAMFLIVLSVEAVGFILTGEGFSDAPPRAMWALNPVSLWLLVGLILGAWVAGLGWGTYALANLWRTRR